MPIYEYKCNACGKDFETLVMGSLKPQCPECESQDLARLMSKCGFVSKSAGPGGQVQTTTSAGSSGCAGCSATNCSTCSSSATIG
ncbi:MAG: zinc ribbon domain-containing protein [Desulfobacter sp.]|nr:MAG: zinc ribbon domain-containing protein [Desulfobacter sp.]